jgi:hypothetical protein
MRQHGIETTINGTLFRSRLEARWAVMFTQLGWDWEYEPFDTEHYIPDFVLLGDCPTLVEVKPATTLLEYSQHVDRIDRSLVGHWDDRDVLIVGVHHTFGDPMWSYPGIGLLGQATGTPHRVWDYGLWHTCAECDCISFHHASQSYQSRICGHYEGDHTLGRPAMGLIHNAWAASRNATRWKP